MQPEISSGQSSATGQHEHEHEHEHEQDAIVPRFKDRKDLTRNGVLLRLVIFSVLLAFAVKPVWWSPGGDSLSYVSIARSLGQHGQLRRFGRSFLYHPPGVSFLYAPAFWFGDRPFVLMSILQWFAAVIAMISVYAWFRRWLNRDRSVILCLLVFFNACTWGYYIRFLSETWFCCLLFGLAVIYQYLLDALTQKQFKRCTVLAGLSMPLLAWLVLTRPVGVFITGGLGLALFLTCLKKRNRAVWVYGMSLAVVLNLLAAIVSFGWMSYDKHQAHLYGGATYINQVFAPDQSLFFTVLDNVHRRINTVGRLMVPGLFGTYAELGDWFNPLMLLYVALSGLVFWGFVRLLRGRIDAFVWMVPLYVGMYLIWPYGQGTRFFIPILPVLLLAGYQMIARYTWRDKFILVLLVLHMVFLAGRYVKEWPKALALHHQWAQLDEVADQVRKIDKPGMVWATADMDNDQVSMLSFATNKPYVLIERCDESLIPDGIVMASGGVLPVSYPLFKEVVKVQDFVILCRVR